MTRLSAAEEEALVARHPGVFAGSLRSRLTGWLVAAGIALYLAFAWWFFSVGQVFSNGNWDIAGSYLADWVSYEVRPDIAYRDNHLDISYPRFSPLGENPAPEWLETRRAVVEIRAEEPASAATGGATTGTGFLGSVEGGAESFLGRTESPAGGGASAAEPQAGAPPQPARRQEAVVEATVHFSSSARLDIAVGLVTVTRGGETLILDITPDGRVEPRGTLPAWASQRAPGAKVIARFGFSGRAEIEGDEVKVRRRFLGWENFFFDARSPFWGLSAGEVARVVLFGERLEPERSNAALAWDNFLNNAEWQHGDVWLKLLQTIAMAFAGTVLATLLAFPLAFAAARNIYPNRIANFLFKRVFDFLRSVDMLIWALFFTRAFGPGPLAGIAAIFFTDTGTFGKLYSEALENIDDKQREGVRSVGASPAAVQRYGVLPQVLPIFLSQSLYFWESNTRSATIIGAVGAGGIGLKLWEAMRTNSDWENVAYMVLLILLVVFVFDNVSSALRHRLMGTARR
ncbi:phosphonate ABC transporter, permease protein PhnE [Chelativorans intermedius]|uniref:Phosphonate ABC transporter, permease protein PhnE n=1 Tax=Chelativorans intermedius TaxID=515947 RepID=A0ABV6D9U1_9HYPH|nr:phosphonate ABC transporter, permease protein PhnE [Chelativorans intermedius]MCT8999138.1 phosphonate ABC transporter, permease protein PhnE [Chelativorans intermedius]